MNNFVKCPFCFGNTIHFAGCRFGFAPDAEADEFSKAVAVSMLNQVRMMAGLMSGITPDITPEDLLSSIGPEFNSKEARLAFANIMLRLDQADA